MYHEIVRRLGAFLVAASVLFTAIAIAPAVGYGQTPAKKDSKRDAKPTPAPAAPAKLDVNEDPAQIGKRKVNGALGDRFFGWLGGSQEKEMQIGRQLSLEVESQGKLVTDPMVTEYINRVGQNIVLHSDAKVPFTIKVIDADEVNAFALPGGFFYVNRGLILAADNEAELAGVMAHEIAHVAARHAMENQGKGTALQYGMLAGMIFGGGIAGSIIQNTAGITQALAFFKFSRGAEGEADRLGVQYLYASGYDPTAMSTMFEKLLSQNRKKQGTISKLFSSHPQNAERRDESLALAARFPDREEYTISTSEFQRVKAHLMKLTNARAGINADFNEVDDSRPTLKKRQPEGSEPDATKDGESTSNPSAPPKLKKKDQPEPAATPTPLP